MKRSRVHVCAAAIGVCALAAASFFVKAAAAGADGLYTEAQALRGANLYATHCAACHGADLSGSAYGPGISERELLSRWKGRPLGELFTLIQRTMPLNSPGGLRGPQNADILAFMLQRAKLPPGATELSGRVEALNTVKLDGLTPDAERK